MARVLSTEMRLKKQMKAADRENRLIQMINRGEWVLAIVLIVFGAFFYVVKGQQSLLFIGGFVLVICIGHFFKLRENEREQKSRLYGRRGEKEVSKFLADTLPDDFVLINDCVVQIGRLQAQFDHVAIGPNGLFAVETKNWYGRVRGHRGSLYWKIYQEERGTKGVRNPLSQCRRQGRVLHTFLSNTAWADVPIHVVLCSSNTSTKWEIEESDIPIITPEETAAFIENAPAEKKLSPYDIEDISQMILKINEA